LQYLSAKTNEQPFSLAALFKKVSVYRLTLLAHPMITKKSNLVRQLLSLAALLKHSATQLERVELNLCKIGDKVARELLNRPDSLSAPLLLTKFGH
jgi:hypothetical protein